ncbi:hypothetical protein [Clostridium cochlearium]|uniref:hypothetical protein n=1 Tax=Clostridium cochlearium TaxID=1494 RepID=UPI001671CF40|nr:hypothetical protein [Clostridium cochlearium]
MRFKQFLCKHKDILVEDVVTEKNKTIMLGKCMRCGKGQVTIIRAGLKMKEEKISD